MATLKLTERAIEAHKARAKRENKALYLWDTQEPNLGCRVSPNGRLSWMVQVWWDGRGGRCKRYTFHATGLKDARQQAPEHRAKLVKKIDLPRCATRNARHLVKRTTNATQPSSRMWSRLTSKRNP